MSSSVVTGLGSDAPVVSSSFLSALETHDLRSSPASFLCMMFIINSTADSPPVEGEQLQQKRDALIPHQRVFNKDMMELSLLHQELVYWLNHWEFGIITDKSARMVMAMAAQLYREDDPVLAMTPVEKYKHEGDSGCRSIGLFSEALLSDARRSRRWCT